MTLFLMGMCLILAMWLTVKASESLKDEKAGNFIYYILSSVLEVALFILLLAGYVAEVAN